MRALSTPAGTSPEPMTVSTAPWSALVSKRSPVASWTEYSRRTLAPDWMLMLGGISVRAASALVWGVR